MSAPAKVLYLVDGLGLSGKTKAMVDLVEGLDPARYHPEVVCFDTEGSSLYDRLRALDIGVQEVPCADGLNLKVLARIGGIMRRLRPDVVHCYNPRTMLYGGTVALALVPAPVYFKAGDDRAGGGAKQALRGEPWRAKRSRNSPRSEI